MGEARRARAARGRVSAREWARARTRRARRSAGSGARARTCNSVMFGSASPDLCATRCEEREDVARAVERALECKRARAASPLVPSGCTVLSGRRRLELARARSPLSSNLSLQPSQADSCRGEARARPARPRLPAGPCLRHALTSARQAFCRSRRDDYSSLSTSSTRARREPDEAGVGLLLEQEDEALLDAPTARAS